MTPRIRPGRWSGAWAEPNSRSSADGAGRVVITRVQREAAVTDRSTDTGPGGRVGVTLVVAGVALAVVLVLVSWASHERSEPGSGSFAQVEGAFVTAGLTVCTTSVAADPLARSRFVRDRRAGWEQATRSGRGCTRILHRS